MHVGTDQIPATTEQNQLERIVASPLHTHEVAGADLQGAVFQTSDPTNSNETPFNAGTLQQRPVLIVLTGDAHFSDNNPIVGSNLANRVNENEVLDFNCHTENGGRSQHNGHSPLPLSHCRMSRKMMKMGLRILVNYPRLSCSKG